MMANFEPFHSAVNRIPVLRRSAKNLATHGKLPALFTDSPAPTQDHLSPERWSGSVDLKIKVHTPVVFGEQSMEEVQVAGKTEKRHYVDLPLNADGTLYVAPTMIKGMISRAYESFTASRFRVFGDTANRGGFKRLADDRTVPLTYRGDAASALQLTPTRITENEDGDLVAELFYGDTKNARTHRQGEQSYPIMKAAALRTDRRNTQKPTEIYELARHGAQITCNMTLCLHKKPMYAYWLVTHIQHPETQELIEVCVPHNDIKTKRKLKNIPGYVCRTAPGNKPEELFPRKHDEKVFFDTSAVGPAQMLVSKAIQEAYQTVVKSYLAQRAQETGKRQTPNRATKTAQTAPNLDTSEQGETSDATSLSTGTLAFAVIDEGHFNGFPELKEIVPTMIGRHAYTRSPLSLAREQMVEPLSEQDQASAADRLFGYVVQCSDHSKSRNGSIGDISARGRIIIGAVDSRGARIIKNNPQLLSPLLSPKPGSARRFLTDIQGRTPTSKENRPLKRSKLFAESGQLLGAAAYPVHRAILDKPGFPKAATADPVLNGKPQRNMDTRICARTWLATGSTLTTTLHFTNLSRDELAALLWVLTPENLAPASSKNRSPESIGYLRMGLGKPLGLGVLSVRAVEDSLTARSSKALAQDYTQLTGCLGNAGTSTTLGEFKFPDAILTIIEKLPWVQAMRRAAYGYEDDVEVRYMTLAENRKNNQTDNKSGNPTPGGGIAPRDLFGPDSTTPIQIHV